ncbi:MAG: hypothetical protein K6T83_18020 [Alicyclobacillus sp.]|nr:hypothetical protein [Alicyclobacillus sp.]
MRRVGQTWLGLLCVGLGFLPACGQAGSSSQPVTVPKDAQKVQVTASNFQWTLSQTSFHVNKPIDFVVQSKQGTHGFAIVGTNVRATVAQGASPVNVIWTPKATGDYTIHCDVYCGSGHPNMFTTIHVGP